MAAMDDVDQNFLHPNLFVHCVEMCCIAAIATNMDFSLFGYFLPTTVVTVASFHNHLNCSPERH